MLKTPRDLIIVVTFIFSSACLSAGARDGLVITIPRRSQLTPVQRLNRDGVEAVQRHHYEKAEGFFYKAYLYDPADPFTLNNLGYISELQGELERANRFYALALQQGSDATIDRSNAKQLEGKPMKSAFDNLQDLPMKVNRMNVNAMALLSNSRGFEAVELLRRALVLDPSNPFTMNNLGVAYEAIGDYDSALNSYSAVAASRSTEVVVVTQIPGWRGRPVTGLADESAKLLRERIRKLSPNEIQAVMFTVRGVSATNRNDWPIAREAFLKAYSLDPDSAFSINNRGYLSEREGDLETAEFFYDKARKADGSNRRVGIATTQSAEGKKLAVVARDSNQQVDGELDKYRQERRKESVPIELTPREEIPSSSLAVPSSNSRAAAATSPN